MNNNHFLTPSKQGTATTIVAEMESSIAKTNAQIQMQLETERNRFEAESCDVVNRNQQSLYYMEMDTFNNNVTKQQQPKRYIYPKAQDPLNDNEKKTDQDTCSCCLEFIYDSVWPGLGLLGESYMLFSVGILRPLWEIVFPQCFITHEVCSITLIESLSYSVITGVILGMISIGYAASSIGRRTGSLVTASFMCTGAWFLTSLSYLAASNPNNPTSINTIFTFFCVALFLFGFGVGGEYPLSASSASEKAMEQLIQRQQQENNELSDENNNNNDNKVNLENSTKHKTTNNTREKLQQILDGNNTNNNHGTDQATPIRAAQHCTDRPATTSLLQQQAVRSNSGQRVQLVFTMQGMGIFLNSIIMTFLISVLAKPSSEYDYYSYYNNNQYDTSKLLLIWQITYTIGAIILSIVLFTRYMYLKESKVWEDDQRRKQRKEEEKQQQLREELFRSKQRYLQQVQFQNNNNGNSNKDDDNNLIKSIQQQKEKQRRKQSYSPPDPVSYVPPDPPGILSQTSSDMNDNNDQEACKPEMKSSDSISTLSLPTFLEDKNINFTTNNLLIPPPDNIVINSNDLNKNKKTLFGHEGILLDHQLRLEHPQHLSSSSEHQQRFRINTNVTSLRDQNTDNQRRLSLVSNQSDYINNVSEAESNSSCRSSIQLLFQHYGMRLFGVSCSWMLWDVAFYGNKLFQSTFLLALTGSDTSLLVFAIAATINSAVALLGYFGAAAILDSPRIGRCRLQQLGFLLTGALFVSVGFFFDRFDPTILVLMYLGSSFFGQLGPNATTFLIPAEIFPTEMRTVSHGIAAASGKLGALIASILFNYIDYEPNMFLFSGYASFAAFIITSITIPETIGLDLYENDKKWRKIVSGRIKDYTGDANKPQFLSWYERNVDAIRDCLIEKIIKYRKRRHCGNYTNTSPCNDFATFGAHYT